jgi:hypothetical protein
MLFYTQATKLPNRMSARPTGQPISPHARYPQRAPNPLTAPHPIPHEPRNPTGQTRFICTHQIPFSPEPSKAAAIPRRPRRRAAVLVSRLRLLRRALKWYTLSASPSVCEPLQPSNLFVGEAVRRQGGCEARLQCHTAQEGLAEERRGLVGDSRVQTGEHLPST